MVDKIPLAIVKCNQTHYDKYFSDTEEMDKEYAEVLETEYFAKGLLYCIDDAEDIELQGNQETDSWKFLQLFALWCNQYPGIGDCASDEEIELYKEESIEMAWWLRKTKYFPLKYDDTMVMKTLEADRILLTENAGQFIYDLKENKVESEQEWLGLGFEVKEATFFNIGDKART